VAWCSTAQLDVGTAYLGSTYTVALCVQGVPTDESNDLLPVDVRRVLDERPGVYPIGSLFQYPLDEINFPESWAWSLTQNYSNPIDRFEQVFQFTPGVGEECVYVMCFEGFLRAGDYGTTQPLTVEQVTTVRCNKVEVYNDVFEWTGEDEGISIQTVVVRAFSFNCPLICHMHELLMSDLSTLLIPEIYGRTLFSLANRLHTAHTL